MKPPKLIKLEDKKVENQFNNILIDVYSRVGSKSVEVKRMNQFPNKITVSGLGLFSQGGEDGVPNLPSPEEEAPPINQPEAPPEGEEKKRRRDREGRRERREKKVAGRR